MKTHLLSRRWLTVLAFSLGVAGGTQPVSVWAQHELPNGAQVVAGIVDFATQGNHLGISTGSDRTIINWNSFSVGSAASAHFAQPTNTAAVLNRVTTANNPSAIYGQLSSNGQLYLINPSGVMVGPGGVVQANGFTASVFDVSNQNFLDGGNLHFFGYSTADVVNLGTIRAGAGGVALLGHGVQNQGTITTDGGSISLVSGGSVTLGDGSRLIHADLPTLQNGISPTAGLINNGGTLRATGALKSGGEIYLVNPSGSVLQQGLIAAQQRAGAVLDGGNVRLQAGTTATIGGDIEVTGRVGGTAFVTGTDVDLQGAKINANGVERGGHIRVGGGFRGNDPNVWNAQNTRVDADSRLEADALVAGDGGTIVVWSDGQTEFAGQLSARGGQMGGDGGSAEVSGKDRLQYAGVTNLSATNGETGTLLLDPSDIEVDSIMAAAIVNSLAGSNVIVQTDANQAGNGNIQVNSPLTYDSANSLTFLAHGSIGTVSDIQNNGSGDINLVAGWNGAGAGGLTLEPFDFEAIVANSQFGHNNGSITVFATGLVQQVSVGSRFGSTNLAASSLNLIPNNVPSPSTPYSVQIGFRADFGQSQFTINGPISVFMKDQPQLTARTLYSHVQIGHGGRNHGSPVHDHSYSGDILLNSASSLYLTSSEKGSAQIGHGGSGAGGNHSGNIDIIAASLLQNTGFRSQPIEDGSSTQIGHGGANTSGNRNGEIRIQVDETVGFLLGSRVGTSLYGHWTSSGQIFGDIRIENASQVLLWGTDFGDDQTGSISQFGHRAGGANSTINGNIVFDRIGRVDIETFYVGQEERAMLRIIGHVLTDGASSASGDIRMKATEDILIRRGALPVQQNIGHYAFNTRNYSLAGDIDIFTSSSLRIESFSSSNIGHGGNNLDQARFSGNISIETDNSLRMIATDFRGRVFGASAIGHGYGNNSMGQPIATSGNIEIKVGTGLEANVARIGHANGFQNTTVTGNTFLAIGQRDFSETNSTDKLITDSRTQINSGSDGQLRIYVPRRDSFAMGTGSMLNGIDVATFLNDEKLPNEQGEFVAFSGPYSLQNPSRNFAFYFGETEDPIEPIDPIDPSELRREIAKWTHDLFDRYRSHWRTWRSLFVD